MIDSGFAHTFKYFRPQSVYRTKGTTFNYSLNSFVTLLFNLVSPLTGRALLSHNKSLNYVFQILHIRTQMPTSSRAWGAICLYLVLRSGSISVSVFFPCTPGAPLKVNSEKRSSIVKLKVKSNVVSVCFSVTLGHGQYQYYDDDDQVSIHHPHVTQPVYHLI